MQLSPEERERIYLEEKAKRENGGGHGTSLVLLSLTIGAMLGLAAVLTVASGFHERTISIDDLRKAYDGLDPEDEQES